MNDSIKREQSELAYSAERENLRPKGKKIINPWRNHEGYNCFGCSPDNPIGLHLEFYEDGEGEAIYFLMNEEKAKEMGFLHCEVEDE